MLHLNFHLHNHLIANTLYWIAIAKKGSKQVSLDIHSDHSELRRTAVHSTGSNNGFDGDFMNSIFPVNSYNKESNWVFWYRLYNVNGALGKGEKEMMVIEVLKAKMD